MPAIHVETPLWESLPLSAKLGAPVYLKMEAFQPVGSFKARGMGAACIKAFEAGYRGVTCSSGGNAGLAVAYAARMLGMAATIVVPESTSRKAKDLIRQEGAGLVIQGESWQEAHEFASKMVEQSGNAYIHPFDDPAIWNGHATMVQEMDRAGFKPRVVVVSVGGGGLLSGLLQGMHEAGWQDVPVVAVETEGTKSFALSVEAGVLVTLDTIDSIATTLGAKQVCRQALDWSGRHEIIPQVVSDRDALDACLAFADDHRVLVEPACGAALSLGYGRAAVLVGRAPVLFIVCGGAGVNRALLEDWDARL